MRKILLNGIIRTQVLQPIWEKLHSLSIVAMNYWGGAHFDESGELWLIEHIVNKSKSKKIVFFDVGANRGFYALAIRNILGDKVKMHCFEPSKSTFQELQNNIPDALQIKKYNFGFSDKCEELVLYSTTESNGLGSIYGDNPLTEFKHQEVISLNTLDDFCESNDIHHIDFLKIDVEGHEYKVLLGSKEMLKSGNINMIQFEIGECNIVSRTFFRDFYELLKDQYRIYRVLPRGLREVKQYKTIDEIFVCVNYLAIKK